MSGLLGRTRGLPRNVYAIGFVSLLNDASSEIIYPLLPIFLSLSLGASPAIIGVIEGLSESTSSILKLFAGYLSDRFGQRKPLVVFGYGAAAVARTALALATSWPLALAARMADRIGKGIRGAPRDALIADSSEVEQRGLAFGFHRAMDHSGAVIGPLLAFVLLYVFAASADAPTTLELRHVFLVAAIPGFLSVVIAVAFVREAVRQPRTDGSAAQRPRVSLRGFSGNFLVFMGTLALFTLSNSSDAFLLLRATTVGVSTSTLPLLWAILHVSKVVTSIVGGDLSDRLGRKRLIIAGWLVYAAVYAGFAFATTRWEVWSLFIVYGAYFGLAEGAEKALVADLVREDQRGTAFGVYNLALGITVFPASLLMGVLWTYGGPQLAFLSCAGLGLVASLLFGLFVRRPAEDANAIAA